VGAERLSHKSADPEVDPGGAEQNNSGSLHMNSASVAPAVPANAVSERAARALQERVFFSGMAIALTLIAFVGFAPSYYLKAHFHAPPELTPLLHWHGAAFTLWMVLLVAQTSLVASGRIAIHRKLGVAGVLLAACMIVLGGMVAITRAAEGALGPPGIPPLVFLSVPLVGLVVFAALLGAAIYFRRRPDFHKRLMLIATMELITAAIARWPGVLPLGPLGFFGLTDLLIVVIAIYDYLTRGRIHAATLWGGLFLVVSQPARLFISGTQTWQAIAVWLTT
jgi:hypothetical protein